MKRKMLYLGVIAGVAVIGTAAWTMTARAGYESAEYKVLESDGNIEIREYPDLMLASTITKMDSQGRDGSFMRLFRCISVVNEADVGQEVVLDAVVLGVVDSAIEVAAVIAAEVADEGALAANRRTIAPIVRNAHRWMTPAAIDQMSVSFGRADSPPRDR